MHADEADNVHSVIGEKPPRELKASDIMALPEAERLAWIHGAIVMTAQTLAPSEPDRGSCILNWYFEGTGPETIESMMGTHSDRYATSVVVALTNAVCPSS